MSAHNIFYGEISVIIPKLSPNTPLICSTVVTQGPPVLFRIYEPWRLFYSIGAEQISYRKIPKFSDS